jgi:hypothetical protein
MKDRCGRLDFCQVNQPNARRVMLRKMSLVILENPDEFADFMSLAYTIYVAR